MTTENDGRYTLDIGVDAVDNHIGHMASINADGALTDVSSPAGIPIDQLRSACTCGWSATPVVDDNKGLSAATVIHSAWVSHVLDDVVATEKAETLRHLRDRLARLARPDVPIVDLHRDLTDALELVSRLTTLAAKHVIDDVVTTPGSRARSAASDITTLATEEVRWGPEQTHQVLAALALLLDMTPRVLEHTRSSLRQLTGQMYRRGGVNLDDLDYQFQRAAARLDGAAEHVHRAAYLTQDLHIMDVDSDY